MAGEVRSRLSAHKQTKLIVRPKVGQGPGADTFEILARAAHVNMARHSIEVSTVPAVGFAPHDVGDAMVIEIVLLKALRRADEKVPLPLPERAAKSNQRAV